VRTTRRRFLRDTSLAAGAVVAGPPDRLRLPIAFSTLGCPEWPLTRILGFAAEHGFAGVEFRGLEGNLDVPSHPAFAPDALPGTRRAIADHGLRTACVSSSASLNEPDPQRRAVVLADARRFIDLAAALDAPFVRVFGNSPDSDDRKSSDAALPDRVAAGLQELGAYAGAKQVVVLIESHDSFTSSAALAGLLRRVASPHVGLLWDAFHTFNVSREEPETTVPQLAGFIRHTHLKDGRVDAGKPRHYVLTGRGDVPVRRQVRALRAAGYAGLYCFEWEKVWHPELAPPEVAIADFARVVGGYLRED
jgi:sugar phosphate isomerase/epimerase